MDLKTADLVIVESSNDVEQRVPLETYRTALEALMQELPASKTIILAGQPVTMGEEGGIRIEP